MSGSVSVAVCVSRSQFLAPDQHICSPAQTEETHPNRKQSRSWPRDSLSSPPLKCRLLTGGRMKSGGHMKSGSGPVEAYKCCKPRPSQLLTVMGQLCKHVLLSLWDPAARLMPRCAQTSLSETELTPAEVFHFTVPVQWNNLTIHWKITWLDLYFWRTLRFPLLFLLHILFQVLWFVLFSHPLYPLHSWQSFSCLLFVSSTPSFTPYFHPPLCFLSRVALYPTSEFLHSLSQSNTKTMTYSYPFPSPLSALTVPFFSITFVHSTPPGFHTFQVLFTNIFWYIFFHFS